MSLYPKLAWQNIRNNRRFYVPYGLALLGNAAAIYIMLALFNDPAASKMVPGRPNAFMYVRIFMGLGVFIAAGFSLIFVLYINSFLMKQRKKELGLYNILGMGKGHIALVLLFETLYIGVLGIGGGLIAGMILHKLVALTIYKMLGLPVIFGLSISVPGIVMTGILFAGLLLLTLLVNLNRVRISNPVELLRGGNVGEREPKTRWLLTAVGVITLGYGYFIAVTTQDAVTALAKYFLAVGLVMIGTYCLFTAVSVAVLKLLRRNKKFYYQTSHFIGVSGMLYRMKQNAVGLSNICILCTMVMVMLSGTVSLYLGSEQIIKEQYPSHIRVSVGYSPDLDRYAEEGVELRGPFDPEAMLAVQTAFIENHGETITERWTVEELGFTVMFQKDGTLETMRRNEDLTPASAGAVTTLACVTAADYTAITGDVLELKPGEVAFYGPEMDTLTIHWYGQDTWEDQGTSTYRIVRQLDYNPWPTATISNSFALVVPDMETLVDLWERQDAAYGSRASIFVWYAYFNIENDDLENLYDLRDTYWNDRRNYLYNVEGSPLADTGTWDTVSWAMTADGRTETYALAGGFLFLGIFLGFIFLMATVLMIYYKQISEGYEDKERFEIMQKVGLTPEEVKRSIHSQILMVFFLPIVVAAVHILFDFHLVELLLTLFYMHNRLLIILCTAGTLALFFLAYGAVYLLTARTYYKIVERKTV